MPSRPVLLVEYAGQPQRLVVLSKQVLSIGRTPSNDVVLDHDRVSRRHAELRMTEEGPLLVDLSSNGTFIGDRRLPKNQPHRLGDGDSFSIAVFSLLPNKFIK